MRITELSVEMHSDSYFDFDGVLGILIAASSSTVTEDDSNLNAR